MQKAIAERITEEVLGTLAGIRVIAGCHFDVTAQEVSATTNTPSGAAFLVVSQGDPEESVEQPINFDDYDLPYSVAYKRSRGEADIYKSADSLRAETFGDIKKTLMRDFTRGGLAIHTRNWSHTKTDNNGSGAVEGSVEFTVWYRTAKNDPFTSAFEA